MSSLEPPIDIGREEAARAAREELSEQVYTADDPGAVQRALSWLLEQVVDLLDSTSASMPGGAFGLVVLAVLLGLALVVIRWRVGALSRTHGGAGREVFGARQQSAAEHRAAASAAVERGELETAVRERFRAIVRDLEERTFLDERPGRTADEVATELATSAPGLVAPVRTAARVFDEVVYGGRPATSEAYALVRAADTATADVRRPVATG